MERREKARRVQAILDELFPEVEVPLDHRDPFTLLVAVLLSAQTTDARVNMVTPALFERAATPRAMAALSPDEILAFIRTCGLAPTKARNVHALARILVERHRGEVPRTFEELEALPGVGHKTASVVLGHAFGIPAFPVDTHIFRLAARWGLSDGKSVEKTEEDLKKLFPPERWSRTAIQIILFGRTYCPALRHDPAACPICSWAAAGAAPKKARAAKRRPAAAGKASSKTASRARAKLAAKTIPPAPRNGDSRTGSGRGASAAASTTKRSGKARAARRARSR